MLHKDKIDYSPKKTGYDSVDPFTKGSLVTRISHPIKMNLEDMPDSEIRERLIALGQNVGPLTPTTRGVHIKKLRNLLAMQGENVHAVHEPTPPPSYSSGDGTNQLEILDSEPIIEDEPVLTQLRPPPAMSETPRASKAAAPQSVNPAVVDDGSDGEMSGTESVRYLSPEEIMLQTNHNRTIPVSSVVEKNSVLKVVIGVILMAMAVFVYFLSDRVHRQTAGGGVDEEL